MNKYDSTNNEWRGSPKHVHAAPWPASLIRRLLLLSLADVMHFCLLFLLAVATANAVFLSDDAQMQSADSPEHAPLTIEQITVEAKARIAEGVPADEVAAWMDQAMASAGIVEAMPALGTLTDRHAVLASQSASLDATGSPLRDRCGDAEACTHRD